MVSSRDDEPHQGDHPSLHRVVQYPVSANPQPTGISMFPGEQVRLSRRWAEVRFSNLLHFNEPARGGHFAALEQPGLFVDEVRATFGTPV